jgi:hypothetical protein
MLVCVINAVIDAVTIIVFGRVSPTGAAQVGIYLAAVMVAHWEGIFPFKVWRVGLVVSNSCGG